jgi:uncharacterized repeat protein (TIGR03803 family)
MRCVTAIACAGLALGAHTANAEPVRTLYTFQGGTDGSAPYADLTLLKGILYGTTSAGGPASAGTLFSFDRKTGQETVLHSFNGTDGYSPESPVLAVGGMLYGAALNGGGDGSDGTVFGYDTKSGKETTLHTFAGSPKDGADPVGNLVSDGKDIYGTTFYGAPSGAGTIFRVDAKNGRETVVYDFSGVSDGAHPRGGLTALGGVFYGTAEFGGSRACSDPSAGGCGTIFKFDPASNSFSVIYSFQGGADGANPAAVLTAGNGLLYGTTTQGGSANCAKLGCGTVFQIDPATGTETVLYRFNAGDGSGTDGTYPFGGVTYFDHALYGMTQTGGRGCGQGCGTIFKVDPATGIETQLHLFSEKDGYLYLVARPVADGKSLYATTPGGGSTTYGTLFKIRP